MTELPYLQYSTPAPSVNKIHTLVQCNRFGHTRYHSVAMVEYWNESFHLTSLFLPCYPDVIVFSCYQHLQPIQVHRH